MPQILFERKDLDAKPNSHLRQVIVYHGRAQAFRVMRAALKPGTQTVVFTSLGRDIEEGSIKASVSDARVRVSSVTLERKDLYFFNKTENEKVHAEVVAALKALIELGDAKTVLAVEAGLISDLRAYLERALNDILIEQGVAITTLREALDFLRDLLNRNRDEALGAEAEIAKASGLYAMLEAQMEKILQFDLRVTHQIRLEMESSAEMEAEIEVAYTLGGASWRPSYDAALVENGSRLRLSVFSEISQASGEDWESAVVVLSSSETETGIQIPSLHPLGLTGRATTPSTDVVAAQEDISELGAEEGETPQPLRGAAVAEKKGTAYTFTLPRPETIPGDGLEHRLLIRRDTVDPSVCFETVPALMDYVYLKAAFPNPAQAPLLPGPVMIYRNGSYIGRTELPYIAAGERCELSFGIDLDIKVKRIPLKEGYVPAKGVGLLRQRREYAYRYILSHFKDAPITVVLKESIPVSEVEKIKIEIEEDTSPGYTLDKEGIVRFETRIPAGGKEHIQLMLHYAVDAPKSLNIEGI
jgi:uncharacterized protein (TIGR02231 family)